ncbi:hypothetical protein KC330_g8980 [Hortaea werneckii]|nr:hypothetical protein KC330_g8980 [Hortaea werneckii]
MTGFAAATGENDDDDDESWDFLTTPPSTPSMSDPLLRSTRDEDKSPESFLPFRQSGNPSTSSRSGIVSTSSSDQNWIEDFLHHQEKKDEVHEQESPLPCANEQEKHQHRFPAVEQFIKTQDRGRIHSLSSLSPSSSASQHRKEPQQAQDLVIDHHEDQKHSPLSESKRVSQQAISKVPSAVRRRDSLDEETKQDRGVYEGTNETRNQGDLDSSGSSDGDGWGVVGGGGDGGEDDEWEMIWS